MTSPPVFYFDLASPYAYLASARVDAVLGPEVVWRPILLGAVHRHFRRVSWALAPELREAEIARIEARAREYGLPPVVWPTPYPANSLTAMRAATWAAERGHGRELAQAAFAIAFAEGIDITSRQTMLQAAERVGLDSAELDQALDDPALKQALRTATERAIADGVYGVPTFDVRGVLWWGDHQLLAAAAYQPAA